MYHVLIIFFVWLNGQAAHQETLVSNEKFKVEQECKDWFTAQQATEAYKADMKRNFETLAAEGKKQFGEGDIKVTVDFKCTNLQLDGDEDEKL